jgi:hypothetical protein
VPWANKKQRTAAASTMYAKYQACEAAAREGHSLFTALGATALLSPDFPLGVPVVIRCENKRSARYMDPTSRRRLPIGALRSSTDLKHTDLNKLSSLAERIFGLRAKRCEIQMTSYVHACTASTSRGMPFELTR